MAEAVYLLCALTSVACAVLLLRGYFQTRTRLLMWSGGCFVGLALNNVLLFVDLVLGLHDELGILRGCFALIAMMGLLVGLVWEQQ